MYSIAEQARTFVALASAIGQFRRARWNQQTDDEYFHHLAVDHAMRAKNVEVARYLLYEAHVSIDWQNYQLIRSLSEIDSKSIAELILYYALRQMSTETLRRELFTAIIDTYHSARINRHYHTANVLMPEILAYNGYGNSTIPADQHIEPSINDGLPNTRRSSRQHSKKFALELCSECNNYHAVVQPCPVKQRK